MTFRHIYISVVPIGRKPIGAGSVMSRSLHLPSGSIRFHPEGHVSQHSYMELRPGEPAFEHQKQILLGPNRL